MSLTEYMIWFIATAAMIITVLTIGTLAAADLLPRGRRPSPGGRPAADREAVRAGELGPAEQHRPHQQQDAA